MLTNVVVRDKKTGEVVKGLKASDFTILENGKPQTIASFDYQNVNEAAVLHEKTTVTGKATIAELLNNDFASNPAELKDHRLIVMFFDLSSMQPEDIDRAVEAAQDYVNKKMQPADLVALVSMATGLSMDQDFTSDKAALLKGLGSTTEPKARGSPTETRGNLGWNRRRCFEFYRGRQRVQLAEYGSRAVCDPDDCEESWNGWTSGRACCTSAVV